MPLEDTPENRVSPQGIANFETFYAGLGSRLAADFKMLHVLKIPDGYRSLDFGVEAPDIPALLVACQPKLDALERSGALPIDERSYWWRFWCGNLLAWSVERMRTKRRSSVFVAVRG